jgi:hypothetical protein
MLNAGFRHPVHLDSAGTGHRLVVISHYDRAADLPDDSEALRRVRSVAGNVAEAVKLLDISASAFALNGTQGGEIGVNIAQDGNRVHPWKTCSPNACLARARKSLRIVGGKALDPSWPSRACPPKSRFHPK